MGLGVSVRGQGAAARLREANGVHLAHELPNLALRLGGVGHPVRHKRTEDIRGLPLVSKSVVLCPAAARVHGNGCQVWGVALCGPAAEVRVAEGVVAEQLLLLGAHALRRLLGQGQRVHHAQVERLRVLARDGEEAHRLLVLPVVEEELGAAVDQLRVRVGGKLLGDLAQLIDVLDLAPLRIMAHSLGAAVSLQYAGVYPEKVHKLVAIEGMKIPDPVEKLMEREPWETMRHWIESVKENSRRTPRRYETIDEAAARMQEENPHLSAEQARHLTVHGVARNEDGTFTWKFDNDARPLFPQRLDREARATTWRRIACPTLLVHGSESWHGDPTSDGRADNVANATVVGFEDAGHWVHHDQLEGFLAAARDFLRD